MPRLVNAQLAIDLYEAQPTQHDWSAGRALPLRAPFRTGREARRTNGEFLHFRGTLGLPYSAAGLCWMVQGLHTRSVDQMSKLKGKAAIRAFLLANVGKVVTTEQIRDVSGGQVQYSRRLRELREQEGWKISSNNDRTDLGPGEYRLEELPPDRPAYQFASQISQRLRAQVLERNGYTCQMCGIGAGEPDDDGRSGSAPCRAHCGPQSRRHGHAGQSPCLVQPVQSRS